MIPVSSMSSRFAAGGDLGDDLIDGIAVLPLYNDLSVCCHRDHTHGTDMPDNLTDTLVSVRQLNLIPLDIQNHALEDIFGPNLYFSQFSFFHLENLSVLE